MKDACETYAECYTIKKQSYLTAELTVKGDGKQLTVMRRTVRPNGKA